MCLRAITVAAIAWMVFSPGGPARATSPDLVIRLDDGSSRAFALEVVRYLEFAGDSLRIRLDAGDQSFAVGDIVSLAFAWHPTGVVDPGDGEALTRIAHLLPNQPNPGGPETRIAFELPRAGAVRLRIYGVDGRLVRSLVNEARDAGRHSVRWDARDDAGRPAPSGVYVYRLEAIGIDESRKLLLVR